MYKRQLFRQCKFYLDKYREIGSLSSAIPACTLELVELEIRLHGGVIAEQFSEDTTHIVFDKQDLSRVAELRRLEKSHSRKHHFVIADWVTDSIECEYTKNERFYEPRT